MNSTTSELILGTAGHIDHGKTSLIRALTGTDTDRLPEEKKRGITIELGFAELLVGPYLLGIVDVPGHERFVRTMLAGATGMDLAMLVVAADDSVKPQTREHLDILKLLDIQAGVIALTKCDLVEPDWLELVEDDVRQLVAGTVLSESPVIRTSVQTGEGIEQLRTALHEAATVAAARRRHSGGVQPFRMAIDRCFTVAGHGTVVTGSVGSGRARVGDELAIEPGHVRVRVRGLENHGRLVEEIHRGQRAAINLGGIHHEAIERGHELAAPGFLKPSRRLTVWLSVVADAPRPLKTRSRVRFHVGTAEVMATVALLDRERLEAGESAPAQLHLSADAVTTWNQPFVVRSESPMRTIGGGRVLSPQAGKLRQPDPETLALLDSMRAAEPMERASAAIALLDGADWQPADLFWLAGVNEGQQVAAELLERDDLAAIRISPTRTRLVHRRHLEDLQSRVTAALHRLHDLHPLRTMVERHWLVDGFSYVEPAVLGHVLDAMCARGVVRVSERGIGLATRGPKLSKSEERLLPQLVERFRQAGLAPPTVEQCRAEAAKNQASVAPLLALAASDGLLVEVAEKMYLHADVERSLREQLRQAFSERPEMTVSEIRELLGTTRKFAVPICEYLDRVGFTERRGDQRVLASRATPA